MNSGELDQYTDFFEVLNEWEQSFGNWKEHPSLKVSEDRVTEIFIRLTERLKCNYPFHHPVYAGQMLKPPHRYAQWAYALSMTINPNNHALDGGPPSSEMEKEVIDQLAEYFGYGDEYLGHLTASGTIANLEALWVARESNPGKKIVYSDRAHYTHERMCSVLGIESQKIKSLQNGDFDLDAIDPDEVGTIVVTLGTTGLGEVEPLEQVLPWAKTHNIRIHIDAAYGGFFRVLKDSLLSHNHSWKLMGEADSIVVDPHKHGLQPYGCGCVIFKDPSVGLFYKHDSPYTYFTSEDLHLGEISLECSRAGAAAVAFWTTLQLFPLTQDEGFGNILKACLHSSRKMHSLLQQSSVLSAYKSPELDIIGYFPSQPATTSGVSELSKSVFEQGMKEKTFYVSLYRLDSKEFCSMHDTYIADTEHVTILRSVLMKPEHEQFIPELVKRLEQAVKSLIN